jgi:hypothetical protein
VHDYKQDRTFIRPFQPCDHATLRELLHENRGISLVIIDNADLMFTDSNHPSRSQIQRQLALLQSLALQREVAVCMLLSIPGLSDNPFRTTILSTLRDACRNVYLLAPTLDDPEARYLFTIKITLTPNHTTRLLYPTQPISIATGQSTNNNQQAPATKTKNQLSKLQ